MIEIWENKLTECPSVQVGRITIDFGKKETKAQQRLFALVMNHPDTEHREKYRGPVTNDIGNAFLDVLTEEVAKHRLKIEKKMAHSVEISVDKS